MLSVRWWVVGEMFRDRRHVLLGDCEIQGTCPQITEITQIETLQKQAVAT